MIHNKMYDTLNKNSQNLYIIDNSLKTFIVYKSKDLIEKIYNDMECETNVYETDILVNEEDYNKITSLYKNINSCYDIDIFKKDISEFLEHYKNYKKYNKYINLQTLKYKNIENKIDKLDILDKEDKDKEDKEDSKKMLQYEHEYNIQDLDYFINDDLRGVISDKESGKESDKKFGKGIINNQIANFIKLEEKEDSNYILIYSTSCNTSVVYNDINVKDIEFDDFIIYNESINEEIAKVFHNHSFESFEEFENQLNMMKDIKFNNINVEDIITTYIKLNYIISDNIKYRLKSSILYDEIINMLKINYSNTKVLNQKIFFTYLTRIGLQKKRFSDGFYYYGVEKKVKYSEVETNILYDKLIKERGLLINTGDKIHISIQGDLLSEYSPFNGEMKVNEHKNMEYFESKRFELPKPISTRINDEIDKKYQIYINERKN